MKNWIHCFLVAAVTLMIGCSSEQSDFNKAKLEDAVDSYERFLAKHENTIFADSAMIRLYEIVADSNAMGLYYRFITKHQHSPLADSAKNRLYFLISREDSLDWFKTFAKHFPDHAYADSAISRVFSLTCRKNKEELYKQFVADYPNSMLADSAMAQIYFLKKEKKSKSAYLEFIEEYPKSRYAQKAKQQIERFDLGKMLEFYIKEGEAALANNSGGKKYAAEEIKKYFYNRKYVLGSRYRQHAAQLGFGLPNDLFMRSGYGYYSYGPVNSVASQNAMSWFMLMQNFYSSQDIDESTIEWINFIGLVIRHCRENHGGYSLQANLNREVMAPMLLGKSIELAFAQKNDPLSFGLTNAVLDLLIDHKSMRSDIINKYLEKLKPEIADPFLLEKVNKLM